ncbi:DUF2690 domain-containing protein [Streptomyces sp. NPDC018057]|uniref:helix-turn-helix domain-containing protein n=1 Tax=unclassified Streptomyces TaxID=2593676 RepID=UPI0037A3E78A
MRQPQEAAPLSGPLAANLRELRGRTGLSLAALAARTPYSKSAWHRYLSGAKHPPRSAVEALARLAGADPGPALALWAAPMETGPRTATATGAGPGTGTDSAPPAHTAPGLPAQRAQTPPTSSPAPPTAPGSPNSPVPPTASVPLTSAAPPTTPVPGDGPGTSGRPDAARPRRRGRGLVLPALTLLTALAAVVTALATSSRGASPGARAAVLAALRCHGRSCQGALPGASACARDARTESSVADATYTVRLRWSPSCRAAWSQVAVRGAVAREVSVRSEEDTLSAAYSAADTAGDASPMLAVSSPRGVEACAVVRGRVACTGLDDAGSGRVL